MSAVKAGNIIGILMAVNRDLFFLFHDLFPLCLHRHVGGDDGAGSEPLAVGSIPAGEGIAAAGGSAHRTGSLARLHRNGGENALAAIVVLEGDGIGFRLDLHFRFGLGGRHLFCIAVQNDRQFGTDSAAPGLQLGADAVDQTGTAGPLHGSNRPLTDAESVIIGQDIGVFTHADIAAFQLGVTIHHGHQLLAGDVAVGIGTVRHAGHHSPVLACPVPGIATGSGHAVHASQGGPHHGAADLALGLKSVVANTVHQIVFINIGHFTGKPVIGLHIGHDAICRKGCGRKRKGHTGCQQDRKNSFFHGAFLVSSSGCRFFLIGCF